MPRGCDWDELEEHLQKVLRHTAERQGIAIRPDGFVTVDDVLRHFPY